MKLDKIDFDWEPFILVCVIGGIILLGIAVISLLITMLISFALWQVFLAVMLSIIIILIIAIAYGVGVFY